ncbi:hypothetical protein [Gibbsiella quercinecans]|uniref:hypothetical protein n=1 Tax=Gibbsiella quercinecans TaxID=929813 RepID=UPI00242C26FB|nr:hypothetical protein [Gibbsiella quercinecans]
MLLESGTIYVGKFGGLRIVAYQPRPAEGVSVAYCDIDGSLLEHGIIHRHGIAFTQDDGSDHNHWTQNNQYNWQAVERNAGIAYVQALTNDDIFRLMSMAG